MTPPTKPDGVDVEARGDVGSPVLCFQIRKIVVEKENGQKADGDDPPKEKEILGKMDFSIFPTYRGVEDKVVAIQGRGGQVRVFDEADDRREPRPDYTIILINFQQLCYNRVFASATLPNDGYDIQFIPEFIENPEGTDLRKFRITPSNYKIQRHNVNDILHQRKSWNDLVRLRTPRPRCPNVQLQRLFLAIQKHGYDDYSSSGDSQNGSQKEAPVPTSTTATARTPTTKNETDTSSSVPLVESQNGNQQETPVAASTPKKKTDPTPSSPKPPRRSSRSPKKKLVFGGNNGQQERDIANSGSQNGSERQELEQNTSNREVVQESPPIPSPPLTRRTSSRKGKKAASTPIPEGEGEVDTNPGNSNVSFNINLDLDMDIDIDKETEQVSVDDNPANDEQQEKEPEPPASTLKKKIQLEFFSQAFVPPLDKRNRVIRNTHRRNVVAPINTWLGSSEEDENGGDNVPETPVDPGQTKSRDKDKSKAVTPPVTPVRRSSPRKNPKPATTDNQQDQGQDQPVAGHSRNLLRPDELPPRPPKSARPTTRRTILSDSDTDDGDNSTNRKRKKSKSPPVPSISTPKKKVRTAAMRSTPTPAPSTPPPVVIEDSEIEIDDDSPSSESSHGSGRARRNSANQRRRPSTTTPRRRPGRQPGTAIRNYTPADSQHMLNLVVRNDWGRYVKGNGLWEFVVKHKLLEHRIGVRTYQGLRDHFKSKICTAVENMTAGSTGGPFVITQRDLDQFKRARKAAEKHSHSRGNEFPGYTSVKDVIRV